MEVIIKKFLLVLFCFYSAFFFAGSLLAPVLAHYHFYDLSAVLTSTFMFSCHQQPDRSFWVLGYPVALCARCLGFYLGVMLTSGFMVFKQIKINRLSYLILSILILIDISLNFLFHVNTSNLIRFFVGITMGFLFISCLIFSLKFIIKKEQAYES